jgi:formylglycine-generating enzyme required for sulfatase activity
VERDLDLGGGVKLRLVLVPAGEFIMGSPEGEDGREADETQHRVRITKPFWLGKYEVTQGQWKAMMGYIFGDFKAAAPVEWVSWNDIQDFLKKASQRTGETVSLPTEAQWEYACRSGTATRFNGGQDSDDSMAKLGWYRSNSNKKTHVVGQQGANAWGLHDMHGNVREWCADQYDSGYYGSSPKDDPTGPPGGGRRVLRGGSWKCSAADCRSARRGWGSSVYRAPGFRVVVSAVVAGPR